MENHYDTPHDIIQPILLLLERWYDLGTAYLKKIEKVVNGIKLCYAML
jgi:hypothetical protein